MTMVCSKCGHGSCAAGDLMCEDSRTASIVRLEDLPPEAKVRRLRASLQSLAEDYQQCDAENRALRAEVGHLKAVLGQLVDADDCRFDHSGGCQAHGFSNLQGTLCPNEVGRRLYVKGLDRVDEAVAAHDSGMAAWRQFARSQRTPTSQSPPTAILKVDDGT